MAENYAEALMHACAYGCADKLPPGNTIGNGEAEHLSRCNGHARNVLIDPPRQNQLQGNKEKVLHITSWCSGSPVHPTACRFYLSVPLQDGMRRSLNPG